MDTLTLKSMVDAAVKKAETSARKEYEVDTDHIGKYCDHTVLRAYTPRRIVEEFCKEAVEYEAASVCVNPVHARLVSELLKGTGLKTAVVIGFPLGATTSKSKALESKEAVENGAEELDMVINVGALIDGDYDLVHNDIFGVVEATGGKAIVKAIIETCYLSNDQKIAACVISKAAGAKYVKTSSGFGTWGATVEDVSLMKAAVGDGMGVKASTGIETRESAIEMIKAGATRIGTSRVPQIVTGDKDFFSVSKRNQPRTR
jgi:deoxyribose-phosphate aldolase